MLDETSLANARRMARVSRERERETLVVMRTCTTASRDLASVEQKATETNGTEFQVRCQLAAGRVKGQPKRFFFPAAALTFCHAHKT